MDYRKLNAVTIRDSCPLPSMDKGRDFLRDAQAFLTLEANTGYLQIEVDPSDRGKTAITSYHGLYHFTCVLFGLHNALPHFSVS